MAQLSTPDDALVFSLHQCGALLDTALNLSVRNVESGLVYAHSFIKLCGALVNVYQPAASNPPNPQSVVELGAALEATAAQYVSLLKLAALTPSRVPVPESTTAVKRVERLQKLVAVEQQYRTREEMYRWNLQLLDNTAPPAPISAEFYQRVLPILKKSVPDPLQHYWPRGDRALEGARAPAREMGLVDHGAQRDLLRKRFVVPRRFPSFLRPHRHLHLSGPRGCGKKFLARALHVLLFVPDENRPFDNLDQVPPMYELDARDLQTSNPGALLVELYTYLQHLVGRLRLGTEEAVECTPNRPAEGALPPVTPPAEFYAHATVLVTHVDEARRSKLPLPHPDEHPDVLAVFTSNSIVQYAAETDVSLQLGLPTFAVRRSVVLHSLYQTLQFETTLPEATPPASRAAVAAGFFTNPELVRAAERVAYATGPDWVEVRTVAGADEHAWNMFLLQQTTGLPADVVAHTFWQKPVRARKQLQRLQRSARAEGGAPAAPSDGLERSSVEEVLARLTFDDSAAVDQDEERGADALRRTLLTETTWLEPFALRLAAAHQCFTDLTKQFDFDSRLARLWVSKTKPEKYPAAYLELALNTGYTLRNDRVEKINWGGNRNVTRIVEKLQADRSRLAKFHDERHLLRFFDQLEGKHDESAPEEPLQFEYELTAQQESSLISEMVTSGYVTETKSECLDAKKLSENFNTRFGGGPRVEVLELSVFQEVFNDQKISFNCSGVGLQYSGLVAQVLVGAAGAAAQEDDEWFPLSPMLSKYAMRYLNALSPDGKKIHVVCGGVSFDPKIAETVATLRNVGVAPGGWSAALRATASEPCTLRSPGGLLHYEDALLQAGPLLGVFHRADALTTLPVFVGGPNRASPTVQFLGADVNAVAALRTLHGKCQTVRETKFKALPADQQTLLKTGDFCESLNQRLRWGFLAEYGGGYRADRSGELDEVTGASLRLQWHAKLQQNPAANVNWSELQSVFDRHRGALIDLNSSGPVNVAMFVLETVYLNPRDAHQPRVDRCRRAFLSYALNPSSRALQDFKDTLRTQAELAISEVLPKTAKYSPLQRQAFWETCLACAAAQHVQQQLTPLEKLLTQLQKAQPFQPPYFVDLCVGFVPGTWREQLQQEKVYTRPLSRRMFRLLHLGFGLLSQALRTAREGNRGEAPSAQEEVAARRRFDNDTERLRARQVAVSPFGWTCAALADAVRRGVENFLFCKLQLEFDPNEQCHFYCFQDANVHRASCAHGATPVHCKECRPSEAGIRTFLRNLNALLFETDDQLLVFQRQPLNVNARAANEKLLQAAETATALFAVLQDVARRDSKNLVFTSLQREFERAVHDAGKLVLPHHQHHQYDFHSAVLVKKRKVVQSARRFLVENLLGSVTDALADTAPHPLPRDQGELYVRSALRYFSAPETPT